MKFRIATLAFLVSLACSSAYAGAPAYDLQVKVIRDGKLTHSALIALDNLADGSLTAFEQGDRTKYIASVRDGIDPDGTHRAPVQTCSTYFTGLHGTVAMSSADALLVEMSLSELIRMRQVSIEGGAGHIDLPDLFDHKGTIQMKGPLSAHPAGSYAGFYTGLDLAPGQSSKMSVHAQVVDRSWWRKLALALGFGGTTPGQSKEQPC